MVKKGQQLNILRLLVFRAFQAQYTNSDITLEVRHFTFHGEFFTKDMQSKDNKYAAIHKRIRKYREDFADGNMNDLLDTKGRKKGGVMRSKSVKVN